MKIDAPAICSAIFLILGFIGLVVFWVRSFKTPSTLTTLQVSTTIYMILLSIAIFINSNGVTISQTFGTITVNLYIILAFCIVIGGVIVIEILSLCSNNGWFLPPLFLASITIGLFFANYAMRHA
ncbi:MAG: hypothetical protein ACYDDV_08990 [Methanoregula sp.]